MLRPDPLPPCRSRFLTLPLGEPAADVIDQITRRRAGAKELADTALTKLLHVFSRNDPATRDEYIITSLLSEQVVDTGKERHVRSAQDRQANDVDVFLDRRVGDHLRRLVQAGVDHFHSRIAQRGGNDLRAAVVSIETRLGNEHAYWAHLMAQSVVRTSVEGGACKLAARLARGQLREPAPLPRNEQHFAGEARERSIAPTVVCFLHDEAGRGAQLGEARRRV